MKDKNYSTFSSHSLPSYVRNRYKANAGADCVPRAIAIREYGDEEWTNGSGLEMYETFYRSYNAQIGRFMQGDPKMEASITMSGYVFSGNNPVMFTDVLGDQMDPGHYGYWPGPYYWRSNFYSYMDKNGTKWHHQDIMAGTGAAGIPYTEGWGSDGFGDMTTGPGGGHVSSINSGTHNGQVGIWISWNMPGAAEHGNILAEVKIGRTFVCLENRFAGNQFNLGNLAILGNINIVPFSTSFDVNYELSNDNYGLVSSSSYTGFHVSKNQTGIIDLNTLRLNGRISGGSITLLKMVSLSGNQENLSITPGIHIGGFELHAGVTLLGGITMGASYSDNYGQSGGDATMSVGGLLLAPFKSGKILLISGNEKKLHSKRYCDVDTFDWVSFWNNSVKEGYKA